MRNLNKIVSLSIFIFLSIITCSYAGEQEWNALDYSVILNSDGSADIVETWNVNIEETNTMFKDFDLSSDSSYEITNVKVTELIDGREASLEQIYEEQYHVDRGCYYGLMIDYNTFEIAWHVGLDNSSDTRVYKIYYTVENAVKIYSDCTEFYWQFLSDENTMTGRNITGNIFLPRGISNIEKLRVWGHGDFSGNIERVSTEQVKFDMSNLNSNSMLEIRIVTEENIYEYSNNLYNQSKLNSILEEEQKWADEANAKKAMYKIFFIVIVGILCIIFIVFLRKIKKYIQAGKELDLMKYPQNELEYFRDIPDEKNATPARAAYMYYFNNVNSSMKTYTSKIFSATLMQLTLKKYITLEPLGKKNVKITILENKDLTALEDDEKLIYNLIVKASDKTTHTLETQAFEKYAKKHYEDFHDLMEKVCEKAEQYKRTNGAVDTEREKLSKKWSTKGFLYIIFLIFMPFMIFALPIFIELIICAIVCFKNAKKISALSPKGYEESNQWKALKKYMEDFSLLKEKQVPDLILWEKYLIYATTFGISKKVLDQLVEVYPQMTSDEYYRNGNYTYLYIASNNSGLDSLNNLDKTFSNVMQTAASAYSAAHSSGSGGGGGFSGGGGGRRWRWKLWW